MQKICFTFTSPETGVSDKIGGGHHRTSMENFEVELVIPYIVSAPDDYSDLTMCEFIEHVEMSRALMTPFMQFEMFLYIC